VVSCKVAGITVSFQRRTTPTAPFDIVTLRPGSLPRGKRFETLRDASEASRRSQELVETHRQGRAYGVYLQECRDGHYQCERAYCARCARTFRRYLTGELLKLHSEFTGKVHILVILLETASQEKLKELEIDRYRHSLRKRLVRAGLGNVLIVGGFEIVYRSRSKEWVLHINLVVFGGGEKAIAVFEEGFRGKDLYRPVERSTVADPAEQLSYVLKFTTYHRPHQQHGPKKAKAVPLNPTEHLELVRWMAQYELSDYLFLFNARRRGASIELSSKDARKA
jgi:hypothetical protein